KKEYVAANQNWSVDARPDGFIYFANHSGLLEFDGISWKLHRLPNQTILRSVNAVSDSLIYTGGYREIGIWEKVPSGELIYHSLNELAGSSLANNDEFWNICVLNDAVYFHSFSKILEYRNDSVSQVNLPGFANTMTLYDNKILAAVSNQGVF